MNFAKLILTNFNSYHSTSLILRRICNLSVNSIEKRKTISRTTNTDCSNNQRSMEKLDFSKKLEYPAANRNKEPICQVLLEIIPRHQPLRLLEIASGSGQHVAFFAPKFPLITFYPSDCEIRLLESIRCYTHNLTNIYPPLLIDISTDCRIAWDSEVSAQASFDYIYCANMIHISPYKCTIGLFQNAGYLLKPHGTLITYGAYACDGKITPESNVKFNEQLITQDPSWGLRDIRDLEVLARNNGIQLQKIFDMPANNKIIIWRKSNC